MDEVEEACLRALQIGPHYAATVADLGELREDFGPSRNRRIQAKLAAGMMIAACRRGTTGLGARDLVDGNGAIWWAERPSTRWATAAALSSSGRGSRSGQRAQSAGSGASESCMAVLSVRVRGAGGRWGALPT